MKGIKIVVLSLLMLLPIGIIFLISNFGENKFKLPVYFAEDSVEVEGGRYQVTSAYVVPDFNLVDHNNNTITQQELRGSIYVADFFFTRCGSICPKMTTQLTRVQEEFMNDSSVKIISFTVDPKFDSVNVLKQYAKEYGAVEGKWRFVTGAKDSIYALAQKGYFITAMEDSAHPVDFIHSEKLILVDRRGWIRGYYNGTDLKEVDKLITEIKVLKEIERDESVSK